jgi:hypothetical protein
LSKYRDASPPYPTRRAAILDAAPHQRQQTISITVPQEPARAGIDPYRKLIDRSRNDSVVNVEGVGADPVGTRR